MSELRQRDAYLRWARAASFIALFCLLVTRVGRSPFELGMAGLYAVVTAWLVGCEVSPRFNRWSSRNGWPLRGAIVGVVALLAVSVWRCSASANASVTEQTTGGSDGE